MYRKHSPACLSVKGKTDWCGHIFPSSRMTGARFYRPSQLKSTTTLLKVFLCIFGIWVMGGIKLYAIFFKEQ